MPFPVFIARALSLCHAQVRSMTALAIMLKPSAVQAPDAALAAAPEAAPATEPALAEEPIPEEAAAGAPAGDAGNMAVDDKAVENMTADQAAASVAAQNVADAAVEKAAAGAHPFPNEQLVAACSVSAHVVWHAGCQGWHTLLGG